MFCCQEIAIGAPIQDQSKPNLALDEQLLGLRMGAPENRFGLDGVELLQASVDVKGIQLVRRHAVRQQGHLQRRDHIVGEGALAGEAL
jgi:hypothetical protein